MDIVSVALKRYSTKAFDATKKLTAGEATHRFAVPMENIQ